MTYLIGIDLGSTSLKAIVYDIHGMLSPGAVGLPKNSSRKKNQNGRFGSLSRSGMELRQLLKKQSHH